MLLDVCLETVFTDQPVEKRIEKIAAAGYSAVEFWFFDATSYADGVNFPQLKDPAAVRQACAQSGVRVNNLVVNAPDGSIGGAPVNENDLNKYLERLDEVITYAESINCHKGITCSGNLQPGLTREEMNANLEIAFYRAAEVAAKRNFILVVEPLNTMVDHAGYFLDSSAEAAEIIRAVNSPNLRLLYDIYHMQIMEGNLISTITSLLPIIGHFHAAGVPGRGELFGNEINYQEVYRRISTAGYDGSFGLEYFPKMADHMHSLTETREYLAGA